MNGMSTPTNNPLEIQSGVIPCRVEPDGVEILLVTSRTRGRWLVPKGSLEPDLSPIESARKEAYEEAGVRGFIHEPPLGRYLHQRFPWPSVVQLYAMEVQEILEEWPEQDIRARRWMSLADAQRNVLEDGLRTLMSDAVQLVASSSE